MNAITKHEAGALPALAIDQAELLAVLRTSLYPGAQDESIKMALGYCKAAGLDPMQKPVHIVPMWDRISKSMRDVIMPGIGLYRTQAARSGALAGISEPEFGPDVKSNFGEMVFEHPEWCRVTVTRRMDDGKLATFTAREYWVENYATAGKDSSAPNAMWKKRPRGQIAKCAQAQALRMAFPEMTGSQPTVEEMEGKTEFDEGRTVDAPARTVPPTQQQAPADYPADEFAKNLESWAKVVASGRKTVEEIAAMAASKGKGALTADQTTKLTKAAEDLKAPAAPKVTYAQVAQALHDAQNQQQANDAATLIAAVADEQQRVELTGIYEQRIADLKE